MARLPQKIILTHTSACNNKHTTKITKYWALSRSLFCDKDGLWFFSPLTHSQKIRKQTCLLTTKMSKQGADQGLEDRGEWESAVTVTGNRVWNMRREAHMAVWWRGRNNRLGKGECLCTLTSESNGWRIVWLEWSRVGHVRRCGCWWQAVTGAWWEEDKC